MPDASTETSAFFKYPAKRTSTMTYQVPKLYNFGEIKVKAITIDIGLLPIH